MMSSDTSSNSATRSTLPVLPAGFRFHPTDEELIVHYLTNQAAGVPCPVPIIAEVNIYACNPWDLPAKAVFGEKEWYFFSPRERKYPNGARPNRAAGSGYWKATGTDKAILSSPATAAVGVKKALVFYGGKPPRGAKTDWIMHEYRLTAAHSKKRRSSSGSSSSSMRLDDWVLCRIYKKSNDFQLSSDEQDGSTVEEDHRSLDDNTTHPPSPKPESQADDVADHHHQLLDGTASMSKSCSLTDLLNTIDGYSALSQLLLLDGSSSPSAADPSQLIIYPTPPAPCQEQLLVHYNNNNDPMNSHTEILTNMASSDDHAANYSSGGGDGLAKTLHFSPSGSRGGGNGGFGVAGGYCNNQQRQLVDASGGVQFQYGAGLMTSQQYPFLINHQLLLNNHLKMQ